MISALALALLVQTPAHGVESALAREWEIRLWALDLQHHRPQIETALVSEHWPIRRAGLEALRRGRRVGAATSQLPVVGLARVSEDHPNVLALALEVCEGADAILRAEELLDHPIPAVRRALAAALGRAGDGATASLADLARDSDERVAAEARASLFALGEAAAEQQLGLLLDLAREGDDTGLLTCLRLWTRRGGARSVLEGLEAWFEEHASDGSRSWRAVLCALDLRHFGARDASALLDGWLGAGYWDPRRQELLVAAGRVEGMTPLAHSMLIALDDLARLDRGAPARSERAALVADLRLRQESGREAELFHLRYDLLDTCLALLGPEGVAEALADLAFEAQTLAFLLSELGPHTDSWDEQRDVAWLSSDRPRAVRLAAVEGFAGTLSRFEDPAAHALLRGALGDEDEVVVRVAFRTLCETERPPAPLEALHAAWARTASADERDLLLSWLPRGAALEPFRADLFTRASARGDTDRLAVELLSTFRGDEDVARALATWIEADLAVLGAAEQRVVGMLRALRAVEGSTPPALTEQVLAASLGVSTEVGKTAAALLAAGSEPARLGGYFADHVDRRTRIEAAIGIARADVEPSLRGRAVERLIGDFDAAAWDLRVRMLDAMGRAVADAPAAAPFLAAVAADPSRKAEDRKRALEGLARAGDLAAARDAARNSADVDLRIVALRLLVAEPGEDLSHYLDAFDSERLIVEQRARLRAEVLTGLARRGELTQEQEAELLRGPLEAAGETLVSRFAGRRVAEPGFTWRGELDALEALARQGRLGAVLTDAALARLDGLLLLTLGERALAAGAVEQAWSLYRAAIIALEGEPDPPPGKLDLARCRLLGLAWETGRWSAAAAQARELLSAWRMRRISDSVFEQVFGVEDLSGGLEPQARLSATIHQATARDLLSRGEVEQASRSARRAREVLGSSHAAAAEQVRLEAALAERVRSAREQSQR